MRRELLGFLVAGGLAAGANYGSRFLFSQWMPYVPAIVCAYLVGMVTAFVLMRRFVFAASGKPLAPQIAKFIAVNALAAVQTVVISVALARWVLPATGMHEETIEAVAHFVGVAVPVVTSYFGHRLSTFA